MIDENHVPAYIALGEALRTAGFLPSTMIEAARTQLLINELVEVVQHYDLGQSGAFRPLADIPYLTARQLSTLKKAGIERLGEMLIHSADDLEAKQEMGPKGVTHIKEQLQHDRLRLRDEQQPLIDRLKEVYDDVLKAPPWLLTIGGEWILERTKKKFLAANITTIAQLTQKSLNDLKKMKTQNLGLSSSMFEQSLLARIEDRLAQLGLSFKEE